LGEEERGWGEIEGLDRLWPLSHFAFVLGEEGEFLPFPFGNSISPTSERLLSFFPVFPDKGGEFTDTPPPLVVFFTGESVREKGGEEQDSESEVSEATTVEHGSLCVC